MDMHSSTRRQMLGLGLVAGTTALSLAIHPAMSADASTTQLAGLRFRLAKDYRPDLSVGSQQRLTRAILDFLLAEHPPGTTLSIWDANPRDLPFLEEHLMQVAAATFKGVELNLPTQAVDPVLITAILYNESRFSPTVLSPAGALGMAQFMPDTALQFGLNPIARADLWERYGALRAAERKQRAMLRQNFLSKYSLPEFSASAVIRYAIENDDLTVLKVYQQLAEAEQPEAVALQEYVTTVQSDLAALNFFGSDVERIGALDGRASYAAVTKAVEYIARRLRENTGMTSSAIAAYNAGPAAVSEDNPRSVLYGYGDLPAYEETVRYLQRVMVVYTKLQERLQ
jgi:hypothetical protein